MSLAEVNICFYNMLAFLRMILIGDPCYGVQGKLQSSL